MKRMAQLPLALMVRNIGRSRVLVISCSENGVSPVMLHLPAVLPVIKNISSGQYAALATEIISLKLMSDKRQKLQIIPIRDKNTTIHYCMIVPNVKTLTSVE